MILFVFEGSNREPYVYKTIERLYFPKKNDNIICSFGNNIYDLYSEMMKYGGDGDIVSIMRERLSESGDSTLHNIRSTDISEVYLFFDYDFQNSQFSLEEINQRVDMMTKQAMANFTSIIRWLNPFATQRNCLMKNIGITL